MYIDTEGNRIKQKYIIPFLYLFLFFSIVILPLCFKAQLWTDEVLDSEPAYNLAFRHNMICTVWSGEYKTDKYYFMRPPIYAIILSSFYKIFGFKRWVTLCLSLIPAVLAFCIIYAIAIFLTGDFWASIMSSLLFGLGAFGITMAKWGRADALALLFFTVSLFIFLISHSQKNKYLHFFFILSSGVLMSFSAQTYQLYGLLFMSFIFYYLFELRLQTKAWLKEMLIFSAAFFLTLTLWLSFILKDMEAFLVQTLYVISSATDLGSIHKNNFFIQNLKEILYLFFYHSPLTLIFFIIGNIFFVKRFPQYKNLFICFILLPALFLFLSNILKATYLEIILPLGFVGMGFFVVSLVRILKSNLILNRKKGQYFLGILLSIFFLLHIAPGVLGRYIITIKDWQVRNLAAYENSLISLIPSGSVVLGGPENWYALTRSGSRLLLFKYIDRPSFNWDKIDYVIIPINIYTPPPSLFSFIKDHCIELGRIGIKAGNYSLPGLSLSNSGYSSIVFKVKDKASSN